MISKKKPVIIWPEHKGKNLIKDGTIDDVPFKEVWKECQKWATQYIRNKKKTNPEFKKMLQEDNQNI